MGMKNQERKGMRKLVIGLIAGALLAAPIGAAVADVWHPDFDESWAKAVALDCIEGDPLYYSRGLAEQSEVNHALVTCITSAIESGFEGAPGPAGPAGADGADGADGAAGPAGADGVDGENGVTNILRVEGTVVGPDGDNGKSATAACTGGRILVGGGAQVTATSGNVGEIAITASYPSSATVWTATGHEGLGFLVGDWSIQAFALCALP